MAKEQQTPVLVEVTNFPSLNNTSRASDNIYTLLKSKDYKDTLQALKNTNTNIQNSTKQSTALLKDIKDSLTGLTRRGQVTTQSSTSQPSLANGFDTEWADKVLDTIEDIRDFVKATTEEQREELKRAKESRDRLLETINDQNKTNDEIIKEAREQTKKEEERRKRRDARDQRDEARGYKQAEDTAAERQSLEYALEAIEDIEENQEKELPLFNSLKQVGTNFVDEFKKNFRDVFNKWDLQIRTLKESGMGGPNGIMLNRLTKQTMDSTEDLLGWNVSIDKSIKATNEMLKAGQSPRYLREQNKQLITGLTAVGLQLDPSTIRALGQSVFDATQVKEITQGWAQIISPDTENAIDESQVSQFLNSDDFKQAMSVMMAGGASQAEIQQEVIRQTKEMVKGGMTGKTALETAMAAAQVNLGFGQPIKYSDNLQTLIGLAQMSGSFTGDIGDLPRALQEAVKRSKSDAALNQRIKMVNAQMALSGDYTVLDNFINNDGHTRRLATMKEIESGQYEGLIPRMTKTVAGWLPAESIGGYSQTLTGDSGFLTQQGSIVAGGLFSTIGGALSGAIGKSGQTALLGKIEYNTRQGNNLVEGIAGKGGKGGMLGKIGTALGAAGPIAIAIAGIAALVGLWFHEDTIGEQSKTLASEAEERAKEFIIQEKSLEDQKRRAIKEGNRELVQQIDAQLKETRTKTNQEIETYTKQKDLYEESLDTRGLIGSLITGKVQEYWDSNSAKDIIINDVVLGNPLLGPFLGMGLRKLYHKFSSPSEEELSANKRQQLEQEYAYSQSKKNKYSEGGIIDSEQIATLGEEGKPELVIPLTKENQAMSLMSQAASMSGIDPNVQNMMSRAVEEPNSSQEMMSVDPTLTQPQFSKELPSNEKNQSLLSDKSDEARAMLAKRAMEGESAISGDSNISTQNTGSSLADAIISYAKSLAGVPYRAGKNPLKTPEKGVVCNQLVEYAYNKAGIPLPSRTVHYHLASGDWGLTEEPQPGFVIFSNYGYKARYGLDDWGHLGIIGHGTERIHASSVKGKVDIDPDFTKTLGYEKSSKWKKAGKKSYIFGFLKGVNYGLETAPTEISPVQTPSLGDIESPKEYSTIPSLSSPSPYSNTAMPVTEAKSNLRNTMSRPLKVKSFNPQILKDIFALRSQTYSPKFDALVVKNNPMGVLNTDGSEKEYESIESGIQDFVSKIELAYNELANLSYVQQLGKLREARYLDNVDYDRLVYKHEEKLAMSIDRLDKSVQESNRIASKKASMMSPVPNMTPIKGRSYT